MNGPNQQPYDHPGVEYDDVSPRMHGLPNSTFCCTLAIDTMNSADKEGRQEKHRRINERDCEARARETAEERERGKAG